MRPCLYSKRPSMAGNLNLQRLFVLTGSTTASASELIINSLRSYLDVRVIGKQTFGKTVGMTIYNESKNMAGYFLPSLSIFIIRIGKLIMKTDFIPM